MKSNVSSLILLVALHLNVVNDNFLQEFPFFSETDIND